jgi:hypothetical protein
MIRMIKSRRMRWVGHVALIREKKNAYGILVGKSEGKRLLGRPRCKWENNIKTDLREIRCGGIYWTVLSQDRNQWRDLVNTIINLRVPKNLVKIMSSCATGAFSRRA